MKMSYDTRLKGLRNAMLNDAFHNPNGTERVRVSEQDVSDCPGLDTSKDVLIYEVTDDYFNDIQHEFMVAEIHKYAP